MTPQERFEAKIAKPNGEGGCWIWTGSRRWGGGYGGFHINGRHKRAHRASWIIYRGQIPEGMCVLHRCDRKLCVNPNHLFLGTHGDNMRDMVHKGRCASRIGERNTRAKLTVKDVLIIKNTPRTMGNVALARLFGVSDNTICDIRRGRKWAHTQ